MINPKEYLKNYYSKQGAYLSEHESFLESADIEKDVDFLIKAIDLKKKDTILDIACGQGRHVNFLAEKGYIIDGIDFSKFLLKQGEIDAKKIDKRIPNYFNVDVNKFSLKNKYNKAYWFFSDLANIDIENALKSISSNLNLEAKFLIDTDNIFRILKYLLENKNQDFLFDAKRLELIDKKNNLNIAYPSFLEWERSMKLAGFLVENVYGDYDFSDYSIYSPRLIIIAKKIAQI